MVAYNLTTFETEQEVEKANQLIYICNSLFATYEVAVLVYPESGIVNRIHTSNNLPTFDKESSINESLRKFCLSQVDEVDQERYLQFLDLNTAIERVENSPKGFIQDKFRMHINGTPNTWYSVRLSRVPAINEPTYLLTIQSM